MNNKQDTNKSNIVEPKFNENQAYEELRMIFVIAIETQDFSTLEARIAAWEKKYPLADFTDAEIIRKIKAILNKDFLSRLLGDYLSAKILHEQEKQKEAYDSLKIIIDNAKKSKDYKNAQREIRKWKNTLHENGFNLYSFDRFYRARVCTLLLLPSKELKNQEQATDELNRLKEEAKSMDSKSLFDAISKWQNTYSIPDFPDKLQKELNKITTEVFDSISQKRNSESAILEIEAVLSSNDISMPVDSVASILSKYDYKLFPQEAINTIENLTAKAMSMQDSLLENNLLDVDFSTLSHISPVEATALSSLHDILNGSPHNLDSILNWIYVNRKINYSDTARDEILKQFSNAGYKITPQSSYSIPDINPNLAYQNYSEIDEIRKNVILSYLGIISQGNKLSVQGKDNITELHTVSTQIDLVEEKTKPTMFLEAFDTIVEQPELDDETTYDEKGELEIDKEEELIYNIFIEDIIDNPVTTYTFINTSTDTSNHDISDDSEYQLNTSIDYVTDLTEDQTKTVSYQNLALEANKNEDLENQTTDSFDDITISSKSETQTVSCQIQEIEDNNRQNSECQTTDSFEEITVSSKSETQTDSCQSQEIEANNRQDSESQTTDSFEETTVSSKSETQADSCQSQEIEKNNIIEIFETNSTTSSENTNLLSKQDVENLEQVYELSTYIVIASPILAQALELKRERSYRKNKDTERIK